MSQLSPAFQDAPSVMLPAVEHAGRFSSSRQVPHHIHPGPELVYVTRGDCECETAGGTRLKGSKGTLFILPGSISHSQRNFGLVRTTYVVFFSHPTLFSTTARTLQVPRSDPFEVWIEHLCDFTTEDIHANTTVASSLLMTCLARIDSLAQLQQTRKAMHPALSRALAHVEAHLPEPFVADELARHAGVSVSHMNALFRRQFGCSPLAHHRNLRLRKAQSLLLSPYARVNEVSAHCGYEDVNYFVRLFSRQFGVSPGAWQRRQRTLASP